MQGLSELRESLQEELTTNLCPPVPIPVANIRCEMGQFVLQLAIG